MCRNEHLINDTTMWIIDRLMNKSLNQKKKKNKIHFECYKVISESPTFEIVDVEIVIH